MMQGNAEPLVLKGFVAFRTFHRPSKYRRVVLMPRRWHQLGDGASHHAGDGGKKARSPGRARKKPLKPFAQGMPGSSGEPVVTTSCVFLTRNCGCASGA